MVLKVSFVIAAAISLVSCMNLRYTVQSARKNVVHTMKIGNNGAGDKIKIEREVGQFLNTFETIDANSLNIATDLSFQLKPVNVSSPCSCVQNTCQCCLDLVAEKVSLKKKAYLQVGSCVAITYLPDELALELVVTVDGDVIIDEKISAQNPPPICATVPIIHLASLCVRLYDLKFNGGQFSGCADVEMKVLSFDVIKVDLGCIHIPPNEEHLLRLIISE